MNTTEKRRVYKLASLDDWQLEHDEQDLRGRTLVAADGTAIARIDDMLVDLERERVAALRLSGNRVVDIDYVDIQNGTPILLFPQERLEPAPKNLKRDEMTSEHIPIVEEHLKVGKREVDLGKVRVTKRVVETPVSEEIALREERVEVERRPVNERVSAEDAKALFKDRTVEMTERAEEAVATKEAVVTEEVVVGKEERTRTEHVEDTVRHTEVDVDRDPARER